MSRVLNDLLWVPWCHWKDVFGAPSVAEREISGGSFLWCPAGGRGEERVPGPIPSWKQKKSKKLVRQTNWDRWTKVVRQKPNESEKQRWRNRAWEKEQEKEGWAQDNYSGHSSLKEAIAQVHHGLGVRNSSSHSHPKPTFLKSTAKLEHCTSSLHSFRRAPIPRAQEQLTLHSWVKSSD